MIVIAERADGVKALVEEGSDITDPYLDCWLEDEGGNTTGPFKWQSLLARGYWSEP